MKIVWSDGGERVELPIVRLMAIFEIFVMQNEFFLRATPFDTIEYKCHFGLYQDKLVIVLIIPPSVGSACSHISGSCPLINTLVMGIVAHIL